MEITVHQLRRQLALSCRILAAAGCVREITGHVSARIPDSEDIFVRCRRPEDPGVQFTTVDDIRRVSLDATNDDLTEDYSLPGEFAIHTEIYRSRPDVGAVVHGHPESSLLCGIANLELKPLFGAYDPAAMQLGIEGVPVYPRSVLISTRPLGQDLAAQLGHHSVALLKGHGIVAVGQDIAQATVNAIKLETLSDLTLKAHAVAGPDGPCAITEEDRAEVSGFVSRAGAAHTYARWTWDFYARRLEGAADVEG
jgi:ribulose-5-phosphate 4-epimerase/fuculose-1-phosphate aldolase